MTMPANYTPLQKAESFFIAAYWHDNVAADNEQMAAVLRKGSPEQKSAAANAVHHRGSAAVLRLAATELCRTLLPTAAH